MRKDSPAPSDVHVSTTGSRQRKAPISPDTKLPVTGATLAAQQEDPEDAPVGKGARALRPNPDDNGETALSPFPHDPNALASIRPDQTPRFFGALTDPDKLPTVRMKLSDLTAMQNRVDPGKVDAMVGATNTKPPVVVSMAGRHYIADGHHRATRAWLDGKQEIDVKHKDLEPVSNALKGASFGKLLDQIRKSVDQDADEAVTGALVQVMHDCACAIGAQCRDVEGDTGKGGRSGGGNAKTAKADDKRLTLAVRGDEGQVAALLEHIKETAAIGHSFSVVVDPGDPEYEQKFGFDGDGAFRIVSIQEIAAKRDDAAGGDDAWSIPFTIAKADPDQQLIFGWASVSEEGGRLIVDKQGDAILPEDLEKAAYDFVLHARQHGEMHKTIGTGKLVESMMFTTEKQAALGINVGKVGWWVGFKVNDPDTWAAHKRGDLPEFSIGGSGRRVEA